MVGTDLSAMSQPSRCPSWAKIYAAVPIEKSTKSIRLLTFHRDAQGNISGCLKAYSLGDLASRPKWTALSYTWDSYELVGFDMRKRLDRATYTISIQGLEVPIRENLWHALNAILDQRDRHAQAGSNAKSKFMEFVNKDDPSSPFFRSLKDDALFWIDAICINQSNTLERNHQVAMMKTIYSNAALVIAWLGPFWKSIKHEEEESLIACLRDCAYSSEKRWRSQCDLQPECLYDLRHRTWSLLDGDPNLPLTGRDGSPHWTHERYSGSLPVRAILEHEREIDNHKVCISRSAYWRRMWIIQEVILPTHVAFLYGGISFCADFLANNLQECTETNNELNPMHSILRHRSTWGMCGWVGPGASAVSLQNGLGSKGDYHYSLATFHRSFRYNGCSDQRDRVYALLGLLPQDYPIKADYKISPCILLLRVFQYECSSNSDSATLRGWAEALGIGYRDRDLRRLLRYTRLFSSSSREIWGSSTLQLTRWVKKELERAHQTPGYRELTQSFVGTNSRPGNPRPKVTCPCALQARLEDLKPSLPPPMGEQNIRTLDSATRNAIEDANLQTLLTTRDVVGYRAEQVLLFMLRRTGFSNIVSNLQSSMRAYEPAFAALSYCWAENKDETTLLRASASAIGGSTMLPKNLSVWPRDWQLSTSHRSRRNRKLLQSHEHR